MSETPIIAIASQYLLGTKTLDEVTKELTDWVISECEKELKRRIND